MKPPGPKAILATLKVALIRRPLWKAKTVADFLDIDAREVMAQIEDGRLPWAFNIGQGKFSKEPRILSACVVEKKLGAIEFIGATRNLNLAAVIDLVLPRRDVRSTELARRFSCGHAQIYKLKPLFKIVRPPAAKDGPLAFTVFSRASVAGWLAQRRMS